MIFIDTNVLVYAFRSGCKQHQEARTWIEDACSGPHTVGIAVFTLSEFISVVTHPSVPGGPACSHDARAFLDNLSAIDDIVLAQPRRDFGRRLLCEVDRFQVEGPRVFDLQIALTARDHGATAIRTYDRNFIRLPELEVSLPSSE